MQTRLLPKRVNVDDIKIKMLTYGQTGSGKTTFAATAGDHPALAPVLFLSFEAGLLSVAERGDIDEVEITCMADLEEVFEAIRSGQPEFSGYRTIVVDSGSELYSQSLTEATASSVDRDHRKGREDRTLDDVGLEDYGRAARQTYRIFRALRDLPLHIIVTAHPKMVYPQGADKRAVEPIDVGPAFSGQLQTQLMGIFDFVHYMYTDGPDRFLLTQPMGAYKAKTRGMRFAQELGEVVENPSLPAMYDLLIQTSRSDAAPVQRAPEPTTIEEETEPEIEEEPEIEPATVEIDDEVEAATA